MTAHPVLSVVIIARNEAKNIRRAIESVIQGTAHWPDTEIMLVDSASTDRTVEIAQRYPIQIVRLKPTWFLSASAGRYLGTLYTQSEFLLFLDGDMALDADWLDHALPFAMQHPQAAAISGYWQDVYLNQGQVIGQVDQNRDPQGRVLEVKYLGGAMLCRRSALEQVGGFHPFVKSEEETDLCLRLRFAGFQIMLLPHRISRHYCIPPKSFSGNMRRLQLNLWLGYGQLPRYYLGTKLFWVYLRERCNFLPVYLGVLLTFLSLLLTIAYRNPVFLGAWAALITGAVIAFAIWKRSLRQVLLSVLLRSLIAYSALIGFTMPLHRSSEYPTDVEFVQGFFPVGNPDRQGPIWSGVGL